MPHAHTYRTDDDILEGLRRSQAGSAEALFDRFADRIHGFGLKVCGRSDDAQEILQETLLSAHKSLNDVKHAQAMTRWLLRIAAMACLARGGTSQTAGAKEIPPDDLAPERKGGVAVPIHDWSLDPDEEVRRAEEKRLLKEAIADLPAHYRLVLVLRDMEEMSDNDTSEILQIPVATVKLRLHRARLFVRKELTRRLMASGGSAKAS